MTKYKAIQFTVEDHDSIVFAQSVIKHNEGITLPLTQTIMYCLNKTIRPMDKPIILLAQHNSRNTKDDKS
jgi:hypothetical protein